MPATHTFLWVYLASHHRCFEIPIPSRDDLIATYKFTLAFATLSFRDHLDLAHRRLVWDSR